MFIPLIKTLIARKYRIQRFLYPVILHLTATNRCNSQCSMCNIWQTQPQQDISLECLFRYRQSQLGRRLRVLDITGGEPFLCDLPGMVKTIDNGKIKMLFISTNGLLSEKIEKDIKQILQGNNAALFVDISIDGIGQANNKIRGVEVAYQRCLETIRRLKLLKQPRLKLCWKFTILKDNVGQIIACFHQAQQLGIDFTCKPGANFRFLDNLGMDFNLTQDQCQLVAASLGKIQLEGSSKAGASKPAFTDKLFKAGNDLFTDSLIEYYQQLQQGKVRIATPCYAAFLSVMLHNDGSLYCCPTLMGKLGDLGTESPESIWFSPAAREIRGLINKNQCSCHSQCDQMPALLLANPGKILRKLL